MIIECEGCRRKFRLEDSRIKPPGSSVRCSRCGHIFFVSKAEDFIDKDLESSQKTPLFEDLQEEITTEENGAEDISSELNQGELRIENQNDEELVDLPTEKDLDNIIDQNREEQNIYTEYEKPQPLQNDNAELRSEEPEPEKEVTETNIDPPDLFEDIETEDDSSGQPKEIYLEGTANIQKSRTSIFAKIIYTLITIAALFVIFISCLVILINAEILPKGTLSNFTTIVESIIPVELNDTETIEIVITEHKGRWMNTVNGPIYIVSGLITNESQSPVHYVEIKSEFIAGEKLQYSNTFYAGNTFTDKELKVTPIEKTLSKLKKRNGDIDVNNSRKLAGLNYNIQPGESIPFFSVFPAGTRLLGLRYNLQIINYEEPSEN